MLAYFEYALLDGKGGGGKTKCKFYILNTCNHKRQNKDMITDNYLNAASGASHFDPVFNHLQERLSRNYVAHYMDDLVDKTVLIIPSLTLDREILKSIKGAVHYEERMLCMLMYLRMPRTRVIYVTSAPVEESIIDYYLTLLPGITGYHARQRLTLFSCYDTSDKSLTQKIVDRPRLVQRIREKIKDVEKAHMSCFNVTEYEKQLAMALNIPIYGCDPRLLYLGTKTGSRLIFKKLGIPVPTGFEKISNEKEIATALAKLKVDNPILEKAVIKMNDGFSGEGNAIYYYGDIKASDSNLAQTILQTLPLHTKVVAEHISFIAFMNQFNAMGGIVEEFVLGDIKESPSVQCRINPLGQTEIISTHDQLLGGEGGQVFIGATFPANKAYNTEIAKMGKKIAEELRTLGVLGRFGIDFISVKQPDKTWKHFAIEINLRKGGTTHPFMMLQFLTNGEFNWQDGVYTMSNGQQRCYFASDNVVSDKYIGLTPHDLIEIAMCNHLLYDGSKQTGVMFHMIGALSQYGKIGVVCIGKTVEEARDFYNKTIELLDKESAYH
jgi:hypothetical protein